MGRYQGWENFRPGQHQTKNPENQRRGYINREMGAAFEERLKVACDYYRNIGVANVKKTPEPFKVTSGLHQNRKGQWVFEGHFEAPAQPDFKGTLRGGQSVVFDAKTTQTDRMHQSELTFEQEKDLRLHHKLGALTFVAVSACLHGCYVVPWEIWEHMKVRYGRKYMTLGELEEFKVPELGGIPLIFGKVNQYENR